MFVTEKYLSKFTIIFPVENGIPKKSLETSLIVFCYKMFSITKYFCNLSGLLLKDISKYLTLESLIVQYVH